MRLAAAPARLPSSSSPISSSPSLCAPHTTRSLPLSRPSAHQTRAASKQESPLLPIQAEDGRSRSGLPCSRASSSSRREVFLTLGGGILLAGSTLASSAAMQLGAPGPLLPTATAAEDLVPYVPSKDKTPALKAGVIRPESRYSFLIPAGAKEQRISNVMTGNFCMPNCAEPWLEAVFDDPAVGRVQLLAIGLKKLSPAKNAPVESLGSPEEVAQKMGPYLTGTYYDEDSLVSAVAKRQESDGLTYYQYELNAIDATGGPHLLVSVTTKGEVCYALIALANEKQWGRSADKLRAVQDSFRA